MVLAVGVATTTRKLRLKNSGSGDLLFGHHGLAAGSAPDFTMPAEVPTGRIAAGASVDLALVFAPTSNGTKRGDLELLTNDRARPALTVPLLGAVAGWRVCVVPDQGLDFGSITTGATRTLPVSLQNCGNVALQLTSMALLPFAPTVNEFHQAGIPALPLSLAPGAEVKLDVTYAPSVERVDKASIDYAIRLPADGATPPQDLRDSIPITGTGAPPVCNGTRPTAVLKTALANGVFFNPATFSPEPLETVTLDGSASTAVSGALQYAFRLVSQPQNGNQAIRGTGAKPTLWLELAGDFVVELVVRDAACQSAAATVTIHAVPKGAVHVQLSWSQSYGDLDVHYVGPGGQYFQGLNGCVFSPCGDTFFGMARPDWGCADRNCNAPNGVYPDGKTANDASLDIDQQWGNGPENINHKLAFDGSYEVWVHYFCAHKCDYSAGTCSGNAFGDATPTIKVFVNGVQQFAKSINLSEFAAWDVARVTVSGNGTQITVADANRAPVPSPQGCLNH